MAAPRLPHNLIRSLRRNPQARVHIPVPLVADFILRLLHASSRYFVAANAYIFRHNSRFIVTTIAAITTVAPARTGKFPPSVARLITAPSPVVGIVWPGKWKYSATMLAFHAPPDAVTKPVIMNGKIPGRNRIRQ